MSPFSPFLLLIFSLLALPSSPLHLISPPGPSLITSSSSVTLLYALPDPNPDPNSPSSVCIIVDSVELACKPVLPDDPPYASFDLTLPPGTYSIQASASSQNPTPPISITSSAPASCPSLPSPRPVYDGFTFNDERELLLLRLRLLSPHVTKFLLVESDRTFTGKPKAALFRDTLSRDPEFAPYLSQIISTVHGLPPPSASVTAWDNEYVRSERSERKKKLAAAAHHRATPATNVSASNRRERQQPA